MTPTRQCLWMVTTSQCGVLSDYGGPWCALLNSSSATMTHRTSSGIEWEPNDEEILALDLQGAASPMQFEGKLSDMNAAVMAKEGFYLVKSLSDTATAKGWCFLTLWEGFGVEEATWETFFALVLPEGSLNSVPEDYLSQNNLGELPRLAEMLASQKKLGY